MLAARTEQRVCFSQMCSFIESHLRIRTVLFDIVQPLVIRSTSRSVSITVPEEHKDDFHGSCGTRDQNTLAES